MKIGQINRGTKFGDLIYEYSKRKDIKTIVEIGTWNGGGSTACILDGVVGTNKEVYSLECNKLRHEEAKVNLGFLPPNFKLIHGTIVDAKELEPLMDNLSEGLQKWLKEDLDWIRVTPNVLDQLPEKIDLCIIDGGEFSGDIEFFKLWERCKFIMLDDTNALKHKKTKEFIIQNPDKFNLIEDNVIERNGFLICEVISK